MEVAWKRTELPRGSRPFVVPLIMLAAARQILRKATQGLGPNVGPRSGLQVVGLSKKHLRASTTQKYCIHFFFVG
jgi:hypothetical protein